MDITAQRFTPDTVIVLNYWKEIPLEDIGSLMLYQKIENTINEFCEILENLDSDTNKPSKLYFSYEWSVAIRDFTILLRDSLLSVAKHEHFNKDGLSTSSSFLEDLHGLIQKAAQEVDREAKNYTNSLDHVEDWKYQKSPAPEVVLQLKELQKQCKKIYRSISKVDLIRIHIGDYIRDFQLQYSFQTSAINNLISAVDKVRKLTKNVSLDYSKTKFNNVVDQIGDKIQELEHIQSTDSIDIVPYPNKETLFFPVSTDSGNLNYKSINIKSEIANWFSSFIYPKIIELERKRDHAIEKCLIRFRLVLNKIAAFPISDINYSTEIHKEIELIFKQIDKDILDPLKQEEQDNNELVTDHLNNYLKASNIYSTETLFLPESGNNQISNLSKDAQKRIVGHVQKYNHELKSYINKILSRYIEIDQTSYSQFIKNKLAINNEDDSLALFLKTGYLGKSFTVARPEIIDSIVEDYHLWNEGFAGGILLSGLTGMGKSTVLGMLNHIGLNEEIIQLNMGESYFIQHRSYEPLCDFKELIDSILRKTWGKNLIICIDDLEQWHNQSCDLFDNISNLFSSIIKHRKKIFFVVTCSTFLKERLLVFKDLTPVFSSQIVIDRMNSNQVRNAINRRVRVKDFGDSNESKVESRLSNIVRESKGNPGYAMLEQCRFYNEDYKSNVKSQEFNELIRSYKTLLTYICSIDHCSIKFLAIILSDIDFKGTVQSIDYLVSQKVLVRPKKGYVSINPMLIHSIENILIKEQK